MNVLKQVSTLKIHRISAIVAGAAFFISSSLNAQIVNGYAQVTDITASTLSVTLVDESGDSFEDGENVLIIQMQDNVLGDSSNSISFGDLGAPASAGLYEVKQIASHTESGGVVTSITLSGSLTNSYSTQSNARLQVVTFPEFGSPDYTTTGDMLAKDWNGNIGGILAFEVSGILTLAHSLSADEAGFRGGRRDLNSSGACDVTTFRSANTSAFAFKGESIYRVTNSLFETARGKLLNGGGGGNDHNGGGGGGGGYTSGGNAGPGWNCSGGDAGGVGGLGLSSLIDNGRIFLGGGGGGGEGNNSVSTDGGDGGGIILVRADEIRTSGSCGGLNITANGESVGGAGNDGGGGGGAGGCIVIEVTSWNIDASCPVTISSDAGDGGQVGSSNVHGGGGGGGQGAVIYSITEPTANTSTTTMNGNGGCNTNANPCTSQADAGQGANNTGILDEQSGPLPIELLRFKAIQYDDVVEVHWSTATEINNDFFIVERAGEDGQFVEIQTLPGAGNSLRQIDYQFTDFEPLNEVAYYRLKQVDFDGSYSYSHIEVVGGTKQRAASIYPNPVSSRGQVWFSAGGNIPANSLLKIRSITGQVVYSRMLSTEVIEDIDLSPALVGLPGGYYIIALDAGTSSVSVKLAIR